MDSKRIVLLPAARVTVWGAVVTQVVQLLVAGNVMFCAVPLMVSLPVRDEPLPLA